MSAQKSPPARGAQDPEALRKKVLEDPHSEQIAQHLGVSLTEYVEQVVHYILNPKEEPSLYLVEDKALRAMGLEPPDPEAMGRFVVEAAALTAAAEGRPEFSDSRRVVTHMGDPRASYEGEAPSPLERRIKAELEKRRRTSRN
jgi:hypothetical protein